MPSQEEFNNKLNEIIPILEEIVKFDIENDLVRNSVLGSALNFETSREVFEKIIGITDEIKNGNLKDLPFNSLNSVFSQTKSILDKLNQIKNFDPNTQSGERQNFITNIRGAYETYYESIFSVLMFVRLQKINPSEIEQKAKVKLEEINNYYKKSQDNFSEIDDILTKSRQAAGKTGISKYASYFDDDAKEYKKISKLWFGGIIAMSLAVAGWGTVLMFWIKTGSEIGEAIQYSIAKFVVLSALFYILVWVTKNYNALRHNYIVNKHRANSLNSFETFVKSTSDDATKDAVLLQATQSIFNPQSTGYDNKDVDSDTSNKFIEILRHFEPKSK